jgi:hypothetical protein
LVEHAPISITVTSRQLAGIDSAFATSGRG